MSAFALFNNVEVLDPDGLEAYVSAVRETVVAHGGRYRIVGGEVVALEGSLPLSYPVLIEFPDLDAARRWYESPEYRPLKALRQASVRADAVLLQAAESDLIER